MARRMLHTNLWKSEQFAKLSDKAKILYIGMITYADDDGRLKGNSLILKGDIFPLDEKVTSEQVRSFVNEIVKVKLINYYKVEDQYYLEHPNWEKYQTLRADRKKDSNIPSFDERQPTVNQVSTKRRHKIREDKLSKDKIREYTPMFDEFWKIYPKKIGKQKTFEFWNDLKEEEYKLILEDIPRRLNDDKWVNGFVKDPERYIKNRQWEDQIIQPRKKVEQKSADKY